MPSVDSLIAAQEARAESYASEAEDELRSAISASNTTYPFEWVDYDPLGEWPKDIVLDTQTPRFEDAFIEQVNNAIYPSFKDVYIPSVPEFPEPVSPDLEGLFDTPEPVYDVQSFTKTPPSLKTDGLFDQGPLDLDIPDFEGSIPDVDTTGLFTQTAPDSTVEEFAGEIPPIDTDGLFLQPVPNYEVDEFTGEVPSIDLDDIRDQFDSIDSPDVITHEPPPLSDITIKPAPEVTLPEFDPVYELPVIADPQDYAAMYATSYRDVLPEMKGFLDRTVDTWIAEYAPEFKTNLAALEAKIATDMQGGRGLSDEFEAQLYTRARTRIEGERVRNEQQLMDGMTKRGFVLPAGAVSAGLQNIHQATSDALAQQATEIAIERAKMELQHLQFVMQMSKGVQEFLLGSALQYANTIANLNGQALQYSKEFATLAAESYNQTLERAKLFLEVYKTEAAVYETELKASLAQIDIYKLELEAEKLKVEVDANRVKLYSELVATETQKVTQYVARIDAVAKRAEFEKLQLELFKSQVEAYIATTQAKEIEYKIYVAALNGDKTKLEAELSKLEVVDKELNIYKANLEAKELESRLYTAAINGDKAKLEGELAKLKVSEVEVELYKAILAGKDSATQLFRAAIELDKAKLEGEVAKLEVYGKEVDAHKLLLQSKELELKIYNAALEGDATRLKGEVTKLEAHNAELEAIKTQSGVEVAISKHDIEFNRSLIEAYQADLEAYKTEVGAESTRFKGVVDEYKARLTGYLEKNKTEILRFEAEMKKIKEQIEDRRFDTDQVNTVKAKSADFNIQQKRFQAESLTNIGNIYGSMAAAALSSTNTMVSQIDEGG